MKKGKRLFLSILITLISGLVLFYMFLPALNIHSGGFWFFVIILLGIFGVINYGTGLFSIRIKEFDLKNKRNYYPFILPIIIILGTALVRFINGPFFMASSYANRIKVLDGNFTEEIKEVAAEVQVAEPQKVYEPVEVNIKNMLEALIVKFFSAG